MRLSQKADYAIRAMLDLALHAPVARAVRSADIARRECMPEKFLEGILVDLRKAGLIKSQRGPVGGHRLARAAEDIRLGEVWRAIDGSLSPVAGLDHNSAGASLASQTLQPVWDQVEVSIAGIVDGVTLADLCRQMEENRDALDYHI
jgi:Rrf2 family protein